MIKLRDYQVQAVNAVYEHLRERDDNPCVVIPTGGGKTAVIGAICRDAVKAWDGRVLILAHVRELLEQAAEKLHAIAPDLWNRIGVYSSGLNKRDTDHDIIVAGIQSVYRRACELGRFDLVIVDEAHLIPQEGDGMYRQFLTDAKVVNPNVRIIGLTATPYRMKSGMICAPDSILNEVCFEIGVKDLIVQGFLCPLRTEAGRAKADTSGLHVRAGEFIAGEVEDLMDTDALVSSACAEIVEKTRDRSSVLIFASGVKHGQHITRVLADHHGVECGFVCGETPARERDQLLNRFRDGSLKYLANVQVLTVGFDAPQIDCVAMLRPTMSPGLYYQMVGRGFRLHPGKTDCLVLDFGGNVLRHGPVDAISISDPASNGTGDAPAKECPKCQALIHAAYVICPECGYAFPPPERSKHEPSAANEGILTGQTSRWEESVSEVSYHVHYKRDDPTGEAPPTMRIEYRCGFNSWHREWVCFEHNGYARQKAIQWWQRRSREPVPATVEEAVDLAEMGALASTLSITIEKKAGEKYERIVDHELGAIPPRLEDPDNLPEPHAASVTYGIDEEDIPF